jgi:hypothetical protein
MIQTAFYSIFIGLDRVLNPLILRGSEGVALSAQSAYNELILHRHRRLRATIDLVFEQAFGVRKYCYSNLRRDLSAFPEHELISKILTEQGA